MYTFVQPRGHEEREKMCIVKFVFPLTSWPFVRSVGRTNKNERINESILSFRRRVRWSKEKENTTVNEENLEITELSIAFVHVLLFDEKKMKIDVHECVCVCVCAERRRREERRKGISKTEHETKRCIRSFVLSFHIWRTHVCISFEYETRTNEREKKSVKMAKSVSPWISLSTQSWVGERRKKILIIVEHEIIADGRAYLPRANTIKVFSFFFLAPPSLSLSLSLHTHTHKS